MNDGYNCDSSTNWSGSHNRGSNNRCCSIPPQKKVSEDTVEDVPKPETKLPETPSVHSSAIKVKDVRSRDGGLVADDTTGRGVEVESIVVKDDVLLSSSDSGIRSEDLKVESLFCPNHFNCSQKRLFLSGWHLSDVQAFATRFKSGLFGRLLGRAMAGPPCLIYIWSISQRKVQLGRMR
jgi:hypothetical protein